MLNIVAKTLHPDVRLGSKYNSGVQDVLLETDWCKKVFQTHSLSYIK